MRIIGGKFKGRPLAASPKGCREQYPRPTSARARTVMFDLLSHGAKGDLITGARALDLFAGTGALGLEALSRGAACAAFVEIRQASRLLIARNLSNAGVDAAVLALDASRLGPCADEAFSLIFLDPPYGSGLAERSLRSAAAGGWIKQGGIIAAEVPKPLRMPDLLVPLAERQVGLAWIGIFELAGATAPDGLPG